MLRAASTHHLSRALCTTDLRMHIKHEMEPDSHRYHTIPPPPSEASVVPVYSVTNENWRGKNDPTERRRIQNRINQRAFRQRQKAGEIPKQYSARDKPAQRIKQEDDEYASPLDVESFDAAQHEEDWSSASTEEPPTKVVDDATSLAWDELGGIINRNFKAAAESNARRLGIEPGVLKYTTQIVTPRLRVDSPVPSSLWPIEAQYCIAHDPYIDAIPHPRLRYNILNAIHFRQIDPVCLAIALRNSGSLETWQGQWQRGGLVVWNSSPEVVANWEVTECFVRKWPFLLHGCEDLLAATNQWRIQRDEQPFQLYLGQQSS